MDELRWSDQLRVGVGSIDSGHNRMAALIDAIERAVRRGEGHSEVKDLLQQLAEETRDHFAAERELMRAGFPEREAHLEEHDKLLQHISKLLSDHSEGHRRMTSDFAVVLREWLMRHIQERDVALGTYLRGLADRRDSP